MTVVNQEAMKQLKKMERQAVSAQPDEVSMLRDDLIKRLADAEVAEKDHRHQLNQAITISRACHVALQEIDNEKQPAQDPRD